MTEEKQTKPFIFLGGELCLDFANTGGNHAASGELRYEYLKSYADLVKWSWQAKIFAETEAQQLLRTAGKRSSESAKVFERALVLRESLYQMFSAIADQQSPKKNDLATLNRELQIGMRHSQIVRTENNFVWAWNDESAALDRMLWRVARSAADLIISNNLTRIRKCADEACGWLFVDSSKNKSRRWCDMKDCGNQAKSRRHYERVKAAR